tara:strand:+ start:932 stop:1606 length:675 start_codon:yes stop_codon:yes gene_type:complete
MSRDFKGIWIPREIWVSKELTMQEKVFLAEIHSLDNEHGCIASNAYFAEFFGLSKSSVTRVISSLVGKGFCTVNLIYKNNKEVDKRIIRASRYGLKEVKVVKEIVEVQPIKKSVVLSKEDEALIKTVLDHLNVKAEKKRPYRRTPNFSKLILARKKEGYVLDDFIHVVDVKVSQWLNTEWDKFLRPSTLFSLKKFPEYASERLIKTKKDVTDTVAESQKTFYDV